MADHRPNDQQTGAAQSVDPTARRPFGRTGLSVTPICIGTSPLAGMPTLYGYDVDQDRAEATVEAILDGPFNFLDTSNNYGAGSAERRIGAVLRRRGGRRTGSSWPPRRTQIPTPATSPASACAVPSRRA